MKIDVAIGGALLAVCLGLAACNKVVVAADTLNASENVSAAAVVQGDLDEVTGVIRGGVAPGGADDRSYTPRSEASLTAQAFNGGERRAAPGREIGH